MELTLAESVLLIALDDAKGSTGFTPIDPGLAGALLVDLGRLGALRHEGKELHPVEVTIAHPVLARAHGVISASRKPRSAKAWVGRLPRDLKPLSGTVASQLVERGILIEQRSKVLGLFPSIRFPEADPEPERMLRSQLRDVLLDIRAPREDDDNRRQRGGRHDTRDQRGSHRSGSRLYRRRHRILMCGGYSLGSGVGQQRASGTRIASCSLCNDDVHEFWSSDDNFFDVCTTRCCDHLAGR